MTGRFSLTGSTSSSATTPPASPASPPLNRRIIEMAVRRTGSDHPAQPWYGEFVSGNSFDTLGLRPYAGRLLRPPTT